MFNVTDYPLLVFALSFTVLWLSERIAWSFIRKKRVLDEDIRQDLSLLQAATLTLLSLLIGFSFSMAISRYDQRKNYEEEEANAIGTEYVRADLLPVADRAKLRVLLRNYLDQRVLFYITRDEQQLRQINTHTTQLQTELWSAVQAPATVQQTPIVALAVSGMNDVLNSQGYTQAAYWNRIPPAAWALMAAIAICCNLLVGYGSRSVKEGSNLLVILPLVISIAFMLIADIDSPHHGFIHVRPQNLISLAESLRPHLSGKPEGLLSP
ncbi:MAG: hypothetical protein WCA35_30595 [Kovacikia sp.]